MNLVLFDSNEVRESRHLVLTDRRADHLQQILRVTLGQIVKVGELGGGIGNARVVELSANGVTLQLERLALATATAPVDLLVALPRPQTLKKVLEISATFGVRSLTFTGAAGVEKSYFQSRVLDPLRIREHLCLGLEQGVSTRVPDVTLSTTLRAALAECRPELAMKFVAHPAALEWPKHDSNSLVADDASPQNSLSTQWLTALAATRGHARTPVTLAIGPESGWTETEVAALEKNGFLRVSLGAPILRVETALTASLANILLLRSQTIRDLADIPSTSGLPDSMRANH